MIKFRHFARVAMTGLIVAVFAVAGLADTIRLKDGSMVKGTITGFAGGKFTIEIGQGNRKRQLVFDASEVESVVFEQITAASTQANRATPRQPAPQIVPVSDQTNAASDKTPVTIEEVVDAPVEAEPEVPAATTRASNVKPIELGIRVLADNTSNGWTNSGWIVKKGQKIRIIGSGQVSLGKGKSSTPGGLWDLEDDGKLLKAVPTGALIAVIGDDNNEFIYVGNDREFTAARDGALFLGVNEGNLNDNTGNYDVKIEIYPGS